jgi:hypothetical protein
LRRHCHYAEGPPADWQQNFVSAYATTHPHRAPGEGEGAPGYGLTFGENGKRTLIP